MTTRRGFLRLLGLGSVAGVAATAKYTIGMDKAASGGEKTAFNFMCPCGESMIAEVPKEKGQTKDVSCRCGENYLLTWHGDHFSVKLRDRNSEIDNDADQCGVVSVPYEGDDSVKQVIRDLVDLRKKSTTTLHNPPYRSS